MTKTTKRSPRLGKSDAQRTTDARDAERSPEPGVPPRHVEAERTLRDPQGSPQAAITAAPAADPRSALRPGRVHVLIGPVGAGKSTFASRLAKEHRAVRLTLDQWMTLLFSPDRPESGVMEWYVERAARCVEQILIVAADVIASGSDVILEIGLLRREERTAFYRRVDAAGFHLCIYVLDAPRDIRRQRVLDRNQARGATFSMTVPPAIFELASDLWEAPESGEHEGRDVHFIDTARTAEQGRSL